MTRLVFLLAFVLAGSFPTAVREASAQQPEALKKKQPAEAAAAEAPSQAGEQSATTATSEREKKLADYLTGATFSGKFTVDGREDASPKTEQYTISKCEKLPEPDLYRMTARIKYGDVDSEVPLDIKILWSGNTPVITLDSFWIPGMGTFGARVLIHSGRYAGTWQHDEVGGHMFGQIKKESE